MKIFIKFYRLITFFFFYLWELILANYRVVVDVLTAKHLMKPGIVAIPLEAKTDLEILILSNLITMTPGTISLDVSDDCKTLFLHVMYIDNLEEFRRSVKNDFEKRVLELLR